MDETVNQAPEVAGAAAASAKTRKIGWREYLETEQAVRVIYLIFGIAAVGLLMGFLQFRTDAICCGDWDGYYHIRWSSLLWENFSHGKWLPSFDWLPLTVLNPHDYADHHFLFHLLQIPFLWFLEPVMAAKVAAVFYSTLAISSVYWLLYRYGVNHLLLWLLAILTCANMFFYRMNMAKAPPLTIIITIAGIYLLFERRYVWLFPLMFAFVWTYSLFPLLFIAAFIWTIILAWNERQFEWRPLAYTGAGLILGNFINPYFPHNFVLFYEHFMTKLAVAGNFAVSVGGEWYPYSGLELLSNFPIALIAVFLGYVLFMPKNGKLPEKATFFLAFVTILLLGQFTSKRYAEYFPPFAILFAAFSWQAFMTKPVAELPDHFRRDMQPYLDVPKPTHRQAFWSMARTASLWMIGIVLFVFFFLNMKGFHSFGIEQDGLVDTIRGNEANDKYERTMAWAKKNIPAGERIFNCNWDDFPKLFFYDQTHSYVYGLDPNYLYSKDPELYKTLIDITNAKPDDPAPMIREKFGARYVFADAKENMDLIAKLLDSGWAETAYEDDEARIIKIRDEKGTPPKEDLNQAPETPEEKKILDDEEKNSANDLNVNDDDDEDNVNDNDN
jgi:hypothetical protein